MFSTTRLRLAVLAAPALALCAAPAVAEDDPYITYEVKRGDTLYGLAGSYLRRDADAETVRKLNRVANPRRLPVAKQLQIPRELLRFERVDLRIAGFSGPVEVAGRNPVVGAALGEGQVVSTGRGGFISFRAANGSQVSLPSNTRARLVKARRYVLDNILDIDFAVLSGRGEAISPKLGPQGRMLMRTSNSVTAVRGTEFRVAYSEDDARSLTEVVEGEVGVAAGGDQKLTGAGFGVASGDSGVGDPEALLPSPAFADPGAVRTAKTVQFQITPDAAATGYRAQVARDAGFVEVVSDQIVTEGPMQLQELENGRYFVRARAISASGLEGLSEAYTFRRKRLDVAAGIEESPLDDGFFFKWLPEGDGETFFAFQMWREGQADRMVIDETGMSETGIILTGVEPGTYQWRVAAIQAVEEGLLKVWGPPQKLNVSE